VIPAPPLHVGASVSRSRPELLVQDVVRELDRMEGVLAPVALGVLLRMRMLDGEPIRGRGVERCSICVAQVRGEVRSRAGVRRVISRAVHEIDGIVLHIVDPHPAALVRVCDRAPVLEAPLPRGRDGAVDASRARGRCGHDAWIVRIERVRNLHHHGDVDAPAAVVVVRQPFLAGDLARVEGGRSVHVDVRAVQGAVAAIERRIHEGAVVGVDRAFPQLCCGRVRRVRESGRGRRCISGQLSAQARRTQAAGQQIVAAAVVRRGHDRPGRDE